MARAVIPLLLLAALTGCSNLVPHQTLHLIASLDPLSPNWEIEEVPLAGNRIHLALKMKRYGDGGAGEAREVFDRRAKSLAQYGGFKTYQVLDYTEGMESSVIGAQRVAEGDIRLIGNVDAQPQGSAPPARSTPESAAKPLS
ncbi:hypothetical protein GALL_247520 [mine drainage metagenome]|uniref:Lipoprotein n=1 Tax=mine drainage metagenome TaxID=410659 RepID=A0A1J5RDB7_9ZZZZ